MNYCTYCGTPLAKNTTTCPNCGRVNPLQASSVGKPISGVLPSDPPLHEETLSGPTPQTAAQAPMRTTTFYNIETPAHQAKAMSFTQSNIPVMPAPTSPMNIPATNVSPASIPPYPSYTNGRANTAMPVSSPLTPVPPVPSFESPSATPVPIYAPYPAQTPLSTGPDGLPPRPPRKKRSLATLIIALVVVLLIIFSALGIASYNAVYVPGQLHAKATAKVVAQQTSDAKAAGTAFANEVTQEANSQAQVNVQATATAQDRSNAYKQATSGTPTLNDPLQNGDLNNWDSGQGCTFSNNAYVISSNQTNSFNPCLDEGANFDNFTFQVHMKISQGEGGGLVLRANNNFTQFYLFQIDNSGAYNLLYYPDASGKTAMSIINGSSNNFHTGFNQDNIITITVNKDAFTIYINKQYETGASNNNLTAGMIGLIAFEDTSATTVQYTNAEVWAN
jgi:hypothetical protein